MRMFVITDDIVTNVIEADAGFTIPNALLVSAEGIEADIGWTWNDGEPMPSKVPLVRGDQVDAERERRIAIPLEVTLSVGTITINMDPNAQRNIQGLASVGQYLVTTGSSQTTPFRDYDNASHDLTPVDLVAMGLQVAQRIQAVYAKSWVIKSMDPIPDNYADDVWW